MRDFRTHLDGQAEISAEDFVLTGGDRIIGSAEADVLSGFTGHDLFRFRAPEEAGLGAGRDTIVNFEQGSDTIDLSQIDAAALTDGNQAFSYIDLGPFSGTAGELRFEGGVLSGDLDGDAAADFEIGVLGTGALGEGDPIL